MNKITRYYSYKQNSNNTKPNQNDKTDKTKQYNIPNSTTTNMTDKTKQYNTLVSKPFSSTRTNNTNKHNKTNQIKTKQTYNSQSNHDQKYHRQEHNKLIMKTSEHEADLLNSLPSSHNYISNSVVDQFKYVTKIRTKQCNSESNSSTVTQLLVNEVQGGVDGGSKPVQCERHDVSGTEEDPNKDRN